ncbi:DNA-3-methyladenine glycosylase family protein [Paenibacillus xylaniclasticus]|uniref:DNA-3-methyladenine glycosylase family protein n=1 Tax=Paenibacillus xylaniclasticus TaxID=588083 RepID=UPI000FD8327B|nr:MULTISPECIES: DNA-3-methyladenine glycosylase [Paenibacillus]GFN30043.1 DNA-3-methyladenine glycosylase II [Paenibacillus curdlanolyticus]
MNEARIEIPPYFSFEQNLGYLTRSADESMFQVEEGRVYRWIEAGDERHAVEITDGNEGHIRLRFKDEPSTEGRDRIVRYVRDWFDTDTDLAPFYAMAEKDLLLQEAVVRYRGLRLIGIPDLFEALCWGILGQQINLKFAFKLKKRFVELFGSHLEWEGRTLHLFPTPERVRELRVEDLTALQITTRKAEYMIGVAELMASGELTKSSLRAAGSLKEAERRLVSIRGIGPWTANYALMRCLRMPNAFPIDDAGLHIAIKQRLGLSEKPSVKQIRELSAGWAGWESYATFYMWRTTY